MSQDRYIGAAPTILTAVDRTGRATSGIWDISVARRLRTQGNWPASGGYPFEVLLVAGGGYGARSWPGNMTINGQYAQGGAGGGGGVVYYPSVKFLSGQSFSISVGTAGQNTTFQTLSTALAGGNGAESSGSAVTGGSGGSGGGGGGSGIGGTATQTAEDGALAYGSNGQGATGGSSNFTSSISGTAVTYGVGGTPDNSGTAGANNTGNGGASGWRDPETGLSNPPGGAGGSGVIILRSADTVPALTVGAGLTFTVTTTAAPGFRIYRFTAGSGTITIP